MHPRPIFHCPEKAATPSRIERGSLRRACAGLLAWVLVAGQARTEVLWQIGEFNESSTDLSHWRDSTTGSERLNYADPAQDPVFVIGTSDPAREWFAFQPGTANGIAGFRPHPFTIRFEISQPPQGRYTLKLALLAYSPRLPIVEVSINGHRGFFYQHPKLAYSAGDHAVFYLPHYSTSNIVVDLPTRFLKAGTNTLVLTAVDESGERNDSQPSGFPWPGSSGLIYDALALEHTAGDEPQVLRVWAEPTIFYRTSNGRLLERIDLFLRSDRALRQGELALTVGGTSYRLPLDCDRDFGEVKLEVEVPEFSRGTAGEVHVRLADRGVRMPLELSPARKWTLFVVPHEHLDIGYTDYDYKVSELQSRNLDEAIRLIGKYPEFRFTVDGFWVIEEFLRGRSPSQRDKLVEQIRAGRIFVPAVHGSSFTGFASLENLIRSLYPSKRFAVQNGTPFDTAVITDVPSYSWSYASVLSASGVKYFIGASDAYRAPFLLRNRLHERSPHWWEGPDGGRVLTWYTRHYHQIASLFSMPPQVACGREALPRFLQAYDRPDYAPNAVIVHGTQVENVELCPEQAALATEWNRSYSFPKIRFSGFAEAMEAIVKECRTPLSVVRGDGGPYWEDGLAANARTTALARRNMQRILSAEKFSTLSALVNPALSPDHQSLAAAWRNLLLTDEHTWHADRSVSDPESQQSVRQGAAKDTNASDAARQIDQVLGRSLAAIASEIPSGPGTLVVFNPLSWARSGLVSLDIGKRTELVDSVTGDLVGHEVLRSGNGFHHVRFRADDIPALGYKCYTLRTAQPPQRMSSGNDGPIMENRFYRITLDPARGTLSSIFDKELGQELVAQAGGRRFLEYLYVTGGDELPNRLVQYSTVSPKPNLNIHAAAQGRLLSLTKTPFGSVARLHSAARNTPMIETEVILHDIQKKVEFSFRVNKQKAYTKEGVYFAFPFSLDRPRFLYATQTGFVDPAKDLIPGASLEWFAVQRWIALEQEGLAVGLVPVDAPLITIGDIARGAWPSEFGARAATIFSYVMNNYTPEGYQAGQGGEFTFRFVLTSARVLDPGALNRLGAEALTPLELSEVTRNDKLDARRGRLDPTQLSFVRVEPPNVELVALKDGDDGRGTILRFVEVQGMPSQTRVSLPGHAIVSARRLNAVEDDLEGLEHSATSVEFTIRPFGIVTVRLGLAKDDRVPSNCDN